MENLIITDVKQYVEERITTFHLKRIDRLEKLKLRTVLRKKNPYLFKAKSLLTAEQIIKGLTDAFISSTEETIFGDWLEGLAIFVNQKVYGGWKSGITGIDLEFDKDNVRYIVAIKSGPSWGNGSQIRKMKTDFITAQKTLRTSNSGLMVVAVNGCCYGRNRKPDKGDYFKFCGQIFWEFISGNDNLYKEIIEPLGYMAKEKNEDFLNAYPKMINKFTKEFTRDFCKETGEIDWEKLVEFNSGNS
ncbi:cytosolic protein [candidate division KSB1 bacterium]|nr:cytosolic protein [candidate division KSB1 bacterium]